MSDLYANPKYYEIAFSFRDIAKEADVLQKCISMYSKIPVNTVLEIGCGNSPHINELLERGYYYSGIDLSREMLEFSKSKVKPELLKKTTFIHADMNKFKLKTKTDFAFIMLGSLYAGNTTELQSHFKCIADSLKSGGLYFLDWCVNFSPLVEISESWTSEKGNISVKTKFTIKMINPVEQLYEEHITLNIIDNGKKIRLSSKEIKRAIYPQEFLCIIKSLNLFEFIGWWNDWDLEQELGKTKDINRPIIILRRK